jgi:hypothetical protein
MKVVSSALVLACAAASLCAARRQDPAAFVSGTVPVVFDDNRLFAEVAFVRPDGTRREALAFVDLGTPVFVVTERLRRDLQVDHGRPAVLRIGALSISIDAAQIQTADGLGMTGANGEATTPVEAILSGSVMKDYQVVFDYAARQLTLAPPGTIAPRGIQVPLRVNAITGLPSVSVEIDGRTYAWAVDTGSAYSWVRGEVARTWTAAHADWQRGTGAVGEANMRTGPGDAESAAAILRLPVVSIGHLRLRQVGVAGVVADAPPIPPAPGASLIRGDLFDWYSQKAPEPVVGWLGGNVLSAFRLTIDFPGHASYWEREGDIDPHDLDQVGLTLERRESGYFVAGIARRNGRPTVEGIDVGDRLVQVDSLVVRGATRGALFRALHGPPGAVRVLVVERAGRTLTVPVTTTRF